MKKTLRKLLHVLALVLVVAVASVGGTIAWLTDKTDEVKNTFTVGNIDIDLYETKNSDGTEKEDKSHVTDWSAKLIPGNEYTKNPVVTVTKGSEKCWLFVEVSKPTGLDNILEYTLTLDTENSGWTKGQEIDGIPENVYYRVVDASTATDDSSFTLITGDKVTVKPSVAKSAIDALSKETEYALTFKAYAVQYENFENKAADAWKAVNPTTTGA